jgi:hypothetical protein
MKTHLIICNEADYLQAHMTFLAGKPRVGIPIVPDLKQRVTSFLNKWILQKMRAWSRRGFACAGSAGWIRRGEIARDGRGARIGMASVFGRRVVEKGI